MTVYTYAVFNPRGPAMIIDAERLIDARDQAVAVLNEGYRKKIKPWDVTTVLIAKDGVRVDVPTPT